ncbi:hypothetical protein BYT27DRAFT_7261276 [Phlegmacium glaucopus]|nr:hypothetical protein BYT27DRAFT_7261276 [Phlegmacium glaucopus]
MALVWGVNSKYPCLICLIPGDELTNISDEFPLWMSDEMQRIYEEAQELNATEAEDLLKGFGLRDVENMFWKIFRSNCYAALSWCRLHAFHGGLFSDHLLVEYEIIVDEMGKQSAAEINKRVNEIPRWSGLNHFSAIMKADAFADGHKFEDMSKVIIFASEDVLTAEESERGFLLLELMRSYLELDMFVSLTVHTEETLKAGEEEMLKFEKILHNYMELYPDKSWNFPKAHTHRHVWDDIRQKGITQNYNTKPNEKAHHILKLFYQLHTNFKNVIPQLLKLNEADLACHFIHAALDILDDSIAESLGKEIEDLDAC